MSEAIAAGREARDADGARPPAVELRRVSFAYRPGVPVLTDVTLAVDEGEFLAVAGPNGGGKTTLLRLVLGLERPSVGEIRVFGRPPGRGSRARRIGYLPQRAGTESSAPVTVRELVSAGRLAPSGIVGPLRRSDRAVVDTAIARVGLDDRASAPVRTLSGGLRQRAFIAKALASEPALLVLDEPTTGVDVESQDTLGGLLEEIRRDLGVTILYVSHEFGAVEHVVERLVLVRGGVVFDGPPSQLPAIWHDPSHDHPH